MAIDNGAAFKPASSAPTEAKAIKRHAFKVKLEVVQKGSESINIMAVVHRVICAMIDVDKSLVLFDMFGAVIDPTKFTMDQATFDSKFGLTMQEGKAPRVWVGFEQGQIDSYLLWFAL